MTPRPTRTDKSSERDVSLSWDDRWPRSLKVLNNEVISCRKCPRLVAWREKVAIEKRRAYLGWEYWGRPVPCFGDPNARLAVIGLAPAAHGGNRTGRMFTGDRSGDFLYRALYEAGFANQPRSESRQDGLVLTDAFITAPVRCAPPDNKPEQSEFLTCRPYFYRALDQLRNVHVVVALGSVAFTQYLIYLQEKSRISSRAPFRFAHGAVYSPYENGAALIACYHPSQQNTSTGKLTASMLREIFARARQIIEDASYGTRLAN